ncbi:hypothetical protein Ocin01_12775 [Orchesella cincta]|uniref:Uncharacterized protein n=1 Tax=Orchesella cincta TaxID=48709 RepID=A0A1D2MLG8_ORCCI|nr:hypothetical protein Ocin01_12775 [Orchesella cincta]
MEFKFVIVLSVLGLATSFTVPTAEHTQPQSTDLESSFPSSYTDDKLSPVSAAEPLSPEENVRDKRGLFKKYKKGGETIVVNRNYEQQSGVTGHYRQREVHHHHYSNPPPAGPTYVERPYPVPVPNNEYHHYHGYQNQGAYSGGGAYSAGGGYSAGGFASGSNYYQKPSYSYGDGGYAHYGGAGGYDHPPAHLTAPVAAGHNQVDRGQGAAAVNNIAIIHARAGSSHSSSSATSESKTLPRPLPVDIDDILDRQGYGMD